MFAAYAGAAAVLVLLVLSSALASGLLARMLHRAARYVPRIAGAVLLLSGIYLVAYWAPTLITGNANEALASSRTSSALTGFLSSNTGLIAGAALAAVVVILTSALLVCARNPFRNTVAAAAGGNGPRAR